MHRPFERTIGSRITAHPMRALVRLLGLALLCAASLWTAPTRSTAQGSLAIESVGASAPASPESLAAPQTVGMPAGRDQGRDEGEPEWFQQADLSLAGAALNEASEPVDWASDPVADLALGSAGNHSCDARRPDPLVAQRRAFQAVPRAPPRSTHPVD